MSLGCIGAASFALFFAIYITFFGDARGEQALGGDGRHVRYANVAVQVD
ncbi:hypothetical protein [Xylella fastidiosa]|nr:hypothetical protein [Xylella fastidiosa]